jgi:hypothetical protein
MARIFKRSFGVIPFVSGQTVSLDLPRNHVFKSVYLRLTGSLVITGGTGTGVFNSEQPMSLIRSIAVVRNGSDVLQRADGGTFFNLARINSDGDPQSVPVSAKTAATYAFSADIPIDFASWRMSNPGSTLLRAVGTSSLRLDVTWGTTLDIISLGDATTLAFNPAPQVEVFTEEIMDLTGDFGDKLITITTRAIAIASTQFTIDLPVGPFYRRLILKTMDTPAGATSLARLSDAIVNRVRIISDGSFFHTDRMSWAALQGMNKRNYALVALLPGYSVVDFAEDGNPGGLIDTRGASSFQVELDVSLGTGATQVQVIQEQLVPARVATAA